MIIDHLQKKGFINPPPYVTSNTCYLVVTGSHAYGVADTSVKNRMPDMDVYGFCLPPKSMIFRTGEIPGFGTPAPNFDQWQQHHIIDEDAHGGTGQEWDFSIYNIVKYFELCREGNANMVDTLFVPENCVLHCTQVGRLVRDNRKLFISKEVWKKFRGYAWSQMHKMQSKFEESNEIDIIRGFEENYGVAQKTTLQEVENLLILKELIAPIQRSKMQVDIQTTPNNGLNGLSNDELKVYYALYKAGKNISDRFEMRKRHGWDLKFGYHLLRLLDEAQQLLETGEMDLQRAKEAMKAIRRGDWTKEDLIDWAKKKEKELDIAFTNCTLPDKAPEAKLKDLLLKCLEEHYGSLSSVYQQPDWCIDLLKQIDNLINEKRNVLYGQKMKSSWWKFW